MAADSAAVVVVSSAVVDVVVVSLLSSDEQAARPTAVVSASNAMDKVLNRYTDVLQDRLLGTGSSLAPTSPESVVTPVQVDPSDEAAVRSPARYPRRLRGLQ